METKTTKRVGQLRLSPMASAVATAILGMSLPAHTQQAPSPATAQPSVAKPSTAAPSAPPPKPVSSTAQPASSASSSDQPQLERIVVSANRRIEKLEDVPQSISVVGKEEIERNNIREFEDLTMLAPALTISTGTQVGTNSINMRGIGSVSNNLGIEGDVAVIVDDLPFAQPQQAFKDLHDIERVEVLKGPQSTLFGKSAIAGAVVVTTAPIGAGPMRGKVSTYFTSDREYRVATTASGRLSDTVGIRVAISKTDFRGLLHNLTNDSYTNGSGGTNFSGKIEWSLPNDLNVSFAGFYSDSKSTGNTSVLTYIDPREGSLIRNNPNLTNTIIFRGITPSLQNKDVRLDDESSLTQKDWGGALRINYLFPSGSPLANHNLTSITGFNGNDANDKRDNDGHDAVIALYTPLTNAAGVTGTAASGINQTAKINGTSYIKTITQELRLVSPDAGNFRYLAGLWYSNTALDRYYLRGIFGIKPTNYTNYETTSDIRNVAFYANSTWEFTPRHTLTLGGRLNQETNQYSFTTISALASTAPANTPYTPYYAYTAPKNEARAFTGKAAYAYKIDADSMVYASYATGRKGVAFDMTSGANNRNVFAFMPLAAETARSSEVGWKANLLENRATVNVAVFHTNFKDYQASSTQTFSDGSSASVLFGIGGVQTRGGEIDIRAQATKNLTFSTSFAYTRARVTDWRYGACFGGRTDCGTNPPNPANPTAAYVNGANFVMPNAPRHNATLGVEYTDRLGSLRAAYFLQARTRSDVQGNINQDPVQRRPGVTVVDAGFSLASSNNKYKAAFGIKNLFDTQYSSGGQGGVVGTLFAPTGAASSANIVQQGWKPARDAFRYYSVRFDVSF
ncbi:MAG: TonB-dependent receptor [Aeromicrobium sp.]|nr:TonB-dependent receptor [Burkholderiales bacterium]